MGLRLTTFILLLAMVCVSGPAWAKKTKKRSKKRRIAIHKKAAFRHIKTGDYQAGIDEMQQAYKLSKHPGFLLNMAVAYDQWGNHCQEALKTLEDFFAKCQRCRLKKAARRRRSEVVTKCESLVTFASDPRGASLEVDGRRVGTAPTNLRLLPGDYEVRAQLKGYQSKTTQFSVRNGESKQVGLQLVSLNAKADPAPNLAVKADPQPPSEPQDITDGQIQQPAEPPSNGSVVPWVSLGIGGLGLGLGTYFTIDTLNLLDEEEQARTSGTVPRDQVVALQDDASQRALFAHIAYGVGLAGVATSIILWALDDGPDEPSAEASIQPVIGPNGAAVRVRF